LVNDGGIIDYESENSMVVEPSGRNEIGASGFNRPSPTLFAREVGDCMKGVDDVREDWRSPNETSTGTLQSVTSAGDAKQA
jgi:hypothetical protein